MVLSREDIDDLRQEAERHHRERQEKATGLYAKYRVSRTDGRSEKGEKHEGCEYFVIDLTHDPHAIPALQAYAESCDAAGYHQLADDLSGLAEWLKLVGPKAQEEGPATSDEPLTRLGPRFEFVGHLYVSPLGRGIELLHDGDGLDSYDWEHSRSLTEVLDSLLSLGYDEGGYIRNVRITIERNWEEAA